MGDSGGGNACDGDPDGDPLAFYIEIWWWNAAQQQWTQLVADWAPGDYYTLTQANGLVANIFYAWRVAACDTSQKSNPWFAHSGFSMFRTVP